MDTGYCNNCRSGDPLVLMHDYYSLWHSPLLPNPQNRKSSLEAPQPFPFCDFGIFNLYCYL